MGDKQVPALSEIRDAFLERWDEIQIGIPPADLDEFFGQSRDDVAMQFEGLATRILAVLLEETGVYRAAVTECLGIMTENIAQIAESAGVACPDLSVEFAHWQSGEGLGDRLTWDAEYLEIPPLDEIATSEPHRPPPFSDPEFTAQLLRPFDKPN
ncbi:MAG: hypothetical protein ACYTFA_11795, partial [Planctomycetota bacterium]